MDSETLRSFLEERFSTISSEIIEKPDAEASELMDELDQARIDLVLGSIIYFNNTVFEEVEETQIWRDKCHLLFLTSASINQMAKDTPNRNTQQVLSDIAQSLRSALDDKLPEDDFDDFARLHENLKVLEDFSKSGLIPQD